MDASPDPDDPEFVYDEFGYFHENAAEHGLPWDGPPAVVRVEHELEGGRTVRALAWGEESPQIVFLHGGAQNAHTWDTAIMALGGVPALAIDLPGHGRSDPRDDGRYDPRTNAAAVAEVVETLAPDAALVVGMSLGGLTANSLAAARPELVRRLVVVDVTPGVDRDKAREIHDFIAGPQDFPSFGEIFERTVQFNPTRTHESLRRGILHNAHRTGTGSWEWNYDRRRLSDVDMPGFGDLWDDVASIRVPYLLLRGALSPVVDDADEAELRRRLPAARVTTVADAGHSIQGDQPLVLAEILRGELGDASPQS
jgi:pimeloyl-ACP methyl ester carboxylesterase